MSSKGQKIHVNIAGKIYPITVADEKEEETVRKAAAEIKKRIDRMQKGYSITINEALSALALEVVIERIELQDKLNHDITNLSIQDLNDKIEQFLKK